MTVYLEGKFNLEKNIQFHLLTAEQTWHSSCEPVVLLYYVRCCVCVTHFTVFPQLSEMYLHSIQIDF